MNNFVKLPLYFKPQYKTNLIRIGNINDGGYLIPEQSLNASRLLYSFGLADDWSFEEEFFIKTNAKVICYDPTVNWKFFVKLFFRNFKSFLKYYQYKSFFNGKNIIHEQKIISPAGTFFKSINKNDIVDLDTLLTESSKKNIFFKIDIEGHEYRILNQLIKYASRMTGLAIEFHNCDLNSLRIQDFIKRFDLQLVHIHVNNWGFISPSRFPSALELTFSPKQFNRKAIDLNDKFPNDLDSPNDPNLNDYSIEFDIK
tara:strand:+ start:101 stop:868 length:768 start_codon:yes stop_codon:yes gene_type:complete